MKDEAFKKLVRRLEVQAEAWPRLYSLRVVGLIVLGYLYPLTILGVLVGVGVWVAIHAAGFFRIHDTQSGVILGGVSALAFIGALAILLSLLIRIKRGKGEKLSRGDVPRLFETVEELRKKLDAPAIHAIYMTPDLNAAVQQYPRLGLLGWHRNYLFVGLQALEVLTTEQFKALLAHELGHVSGNHGRISGWAYRTRESWNRLWAMVGSQEEGVRFLWRGFLRKFTPYFSAYSFVLSRKHEYVADRCSAEMCGLEATAGALERMEIYGRHLDTNFWPGIERRARREADPPDRAARYASEPEGSAGGAERDGR